MSQLVLGGTAKGHELIQQLLHSPIGSRTLPLSLLYTLDIINVMYFFRLVIGDVTIQTLMSLSTPMTSVAVET